MTTTKTVNSAFTDFISNYVDLDSNRTSTARGSRDFLYEQLKKLPSNTEDFPALYSGKEIMGFGSFRRRTKIRPLDDIDLMLVFTGDGTTYNDNGTFITLHVPESAMLLRKLINEDGTLNSRKLIEKIKKSLSNVSQYESASLNRRQEAATLKLKSYEWVFDIVPAFITKEDTFGKSYYIIPDGNGNWKKTDPRIDNNRTTEVNQKFEGYVLGFIRLIKYWNINCSPCKVSSYLIENICLNYFNNKFYWYGLKPELKNFFEYLKNNIYNTVNDPKGIQGNLNTLDFSEKYAISQSAALCFINIINAINEEDNGNHQEAINNWEKILGANFV